MECEILKQEYEETNLEEEGEYISYEGMTNDWGWSELPGY